MTALADPASSLRTDNPAHRLRADTLATRVSFTWLGVRKALNADQRAQAAEPFHAQGQYLSAGKKLIDTRHPAFRGVTSIRNRITRLWRGSSLPYPEPGIRLIRRRDIERFDDTMTVLRDELADAVKHLDRCYPLLKDDARERLGELFNPGDYPDSLRGLFAVAWDFPSVEPPAYLMQLHPDIYEQERQRVATRFDEAVELAEQAFASEFARLVQHLAERLSGDDDGRPKVFRDSAVTNLSEFFDRFRTLNVRSNPQLDDLVERARRTVAGIEPGTLRDRGSLRDHVARQLNLVQTRLDDLMQTMPRRRILRLNRSGDNAAPGHEQTEARQR